MNKGKGDVSNVRGPSKATASPAPGHAVRGNVASRASRIHGIAFYAERATRDRAKLRVTYGDSGPGQSQTKIPGKVHCAGSCKLASTTG